MSRTTAALFASAVLIGTGLVHGRWTDRWTPAAEPAVAAARFNAIPMTLGEWDGHPEGKPTAADATLAGTLQRRYVNRRTGEAVSVYLVCGRPGPAAIHTPEACYGA